MDSTASETEASQNHRLLVLKGPQWPSWLTRPDTHLLGGEQLQGVGQSAGGDPGPGTAVGGPACAGSRLGFQPDGLVCHSHTPSLQEAGPRRAHPERCPWPVPCGHRLPPGLQRVGWGRAAAPQTCSHRTRGREGWRDVMTPPIRWLLPEPPGGSKGCLLKKFFWYLVSLVLLGSKNCLLFCVKPD